MTFNNCINSSFSKTITPYIVGSDTTLYQYQLIKDAIDQAVIDGASAATPKLILISPGTYTENINIYDGIIVSGMNGSRYTHTSIIVGQVSWEGSGSSDIGSLENVEVRGVAAGDCIDVIPGGEGILSCLSCKFDGSVSNRCVNWSTNATCTLRINDCFLVGGSNESISIRNFGDLFMANSRFENDKGSLQFQITDNATAFVFNCLLEGRVQSQDDAEIIIANSIVDYSLGTNSHGIRINTGSKSTLRGCFINTANAGVSAVGMQGGTTTLGTRCDMINCDLLSIASSGNAIERAGATLPDPTLNKSQLTALGTATTIEAGITTTTYPSI